MNSIIARLAEAAKALVAAATPIVTVAVTDILADVSKVAQTGITSLASLVLVYITRNRPLTEG